jgi:hypothetical protein
MFKLNMKKMQQTMAKVMVLAIDKVNLVVVNPPHMYVVGDPCITMIVPCFS